MYKRPVLEIAFFLHNMVLVALVSYNYCIEVIYCMGKSKTNGELHVKRVFVALVDALNGLEINHYDNATVQTVKFIMNRYSDIEYVKMKYDFKNPDFESDLLVTLKSGEVLKINLFITDGSGKIQPKNPGANSFLTKYFNLPELQERFNEYRELEYKKFLTQVILTKENVALYDNTTQLKRRVNELYPKFNEEINPLRKEFLFNLREYLFDLLNTQKSSLEKYIEDAFENLLLLNDINIQTSNANSENVIVKQIESDVNFEEPIELYRKGNDSVGLRKGQRALTLRFKFESAPSKSIKLATSYDIFPEQASIQSINLKSLTKFKRTTLVTYGKVKKDSPNAIGKCNEALIYSAVLEKFPHIYQTDDTEYIKMYTQYAPQVKEEIRNYLVQSAITGAEAIENYLNSKFEDYKIESMQLVPNSYVEDKLDTADLKITIKYNEKLVDVPFSLKATKKRGNTITAKNPGIGTILGPLYFDCGSTTDVVEVTKSAFLAGQFTREDSLTNVSNYIGEKLLNASQQQLLKGLQALLGNITTIITFYMQQESEFYERHQIEGDIKVLKSTPTAYNTKLTWNKDKEDLTLRVKFSGGQDRGWTSLKLAAGYVVK